MISDFTYLMAATAAALATSLVLAVAALAFGWRAARRSATALAAAQITGMRLADAEAALAACTGRLQDLLAERERATAVPARPGLRQAVALSRHGASTDELVATCRIGQSEARLIQMLYGSTKAAGTAPAGDIH
ncbi:MAG: DUF2802 domain-containing protein [Gammaproteobacteria bacterium]